MLRIHESLSSYLIDTRELKEGENFIDYRNGLYFTYDWLGEPDRKVQHIPLNGDHARLTYARNRLQSEFKSKEKIPVVTFLQVEDGPISFTRISATTFLRREDRKWELVEEYRRGLGIHHIITNDSGTLKSKLKEHFIDLRSEPGFASNLVQQGKITEQQYRDYYYLYGNIGTECFDFDIDTRIQLLKISAVLF